LVGQRQAEKDKQVGIAKQQAEQEVKTEEAKTAAKRMEVQNVELVRAAQNAKDATLVTAEQGKQVAILNAEGTLEATKRQAEGITTKGRADGEALKALQLAPVQAQIELAKEIGSNAGYQTYLVALKAIEAYLAVGTEQAKALSEADVKVIATAGNAVQGLNSAMQLFTPQGGLAVGGMIEALSNTPEGKQLLDAITGRLAGNAGTTETVSE